jgi:hypothetical protein
MESAIKTKPNNKTYIIPPDNCYGDVFAIVRILGKTYVCPGWHPVPEGTTRDQIKFSKDAKVEKKVSPTPKPVKKERKSWKVESSKPGKFYEVTKINGVWDCTCPARTFFKGHCKHIKKLNT